MMTTRYLLVFELQFPRLQMYDTRTRTTTNPIQILITTMFVAQQQSTIDIVSTDRFQTLCKLIVPHSCSGAASIILLCQMEGRLKVGT